MLSFKTLSEFKTAYKATEGHFFDRKTMQFFNSRIESGLLKGKYFITSESDFRNENRFFTVREIQEDLSIKTIGDFNTLRTKQAAKELINTHAATFGSMATKVVDTRKTAVKELARIKKYGY